MFIGLDGVMVSMPACSVGDLGSIPGLGEVYFQPTTNMVHYTCIKSENKPGFRLVEPIVV